jgi:hypothetical protein
MEQTTPKINDMFVAQDISFHFISKILFSNKKYLQKFSTGTFVGESLPHIDI